MIYFLGYRAFDFKDSETGRQITGISLHFADDEQSESVGYVASKVSVNKERFAQLFGVDSKAFIMKPVQVGYDRYGKPVSIALVPASKA